MKQTPDLSIIIVNWNTCEYLHSCLSALYEAMPDQEPQVIVVDNFSKDGSVEMVRRKFPGVVLIANTKNRGFSGGVNDGLDIAEGEFIMMLNPDIVLGAGVIEGLLTYLRSHSDVGAVMPGLRDPDGSVQTRYVRRLPTLMQLLLFSTVLAPWSQKRHGLVERFLESAGTPTGGELEVEQIPGAFIMTGRRVVNTVGRFDEAYRLFFEDVDWSSRVRERGLKLMMLTQLEVTHVGGQSFEIDEGMWIPARYFVSQVTFFLRCKGLVQATVAALMISLNAILIIVKNSLLRGWSSPEAKRLASISRQKYLNVLRLLFRAFVLRADEEVLPEMGGENPAP
jgi:N-acetylglucosaminyl-diphospho-decaprenol L-rhamnosyltransferase